MSIQDRLAAQDALQVLTVAAGLSLATAASTVGTKYNFPLMLFGMVAHEMHSSTFLLRQFLTLTLFSIPLDIYVLLFDVSGISLLFSILILLLKAPVFVTCSIKLRERGGELGFGQGSWGFQGLPGSTGVGGSAGAFGRAEQGNSNWNMPGGFGQQQTPSRPASATAPPPPPGQFPSSGGFRLGGEDEEQEQENPPPPPPVGRGGYQTIA